MLIERKAFVENDAQKFHMFFIADLSVVDS